MDLKADIRNKLGKSVKGIRKEGQIPAELYGKGVENVHLSVSAKDFKKVFKEAGENAVVNILIGDAKHSALIQDVSRDSITGDPVNIDFYQVRMDEKVKVRIPLEFIGEAPAVKEQGGLLNKTMLDVEVEALPSDLPHSFKVSLDALKDINSSIYIKDLDIPKGVKIMIEPTTVVATVIPPAPEEVVETPINLEEVKVESEEKKVERQKAKEEEEKEISKS
ncbi:MAG: 50S ribosomal protein L25 [Patescibacteria group bacterium]|nr:50S ribosomal protein L25 [Patescibacteria group bacterium]